MLNFCPALNPLLALLSRNANESGMAREEEALLQGLYVIERENKMNGK